MTHTPTRRLLALLLAVATVFSLLSMSVSAADEQTETQTLTLTADKDVLKVGDTVTITVKVSNNATIGFSDFELAIDYDTTLLKLEHINKSYKSVDADGNETDIPYLTGFYTVNTGKWVDPETGKEYIGYINFANTEALTYKSPKTIFTLDFTVLKCESENTSVTLDKIAFNSIEDGETVSINPTIVPVELSVTHTLTAVPAKDATCTEDGNAAYWKCSACEKWFSDENGTTEITDKGSVVTKATGHTPSTAWSYDGDYHWHVCTTCEAVLDHAEHSGGTATCSEQATCEVCDQKYGATTVHDYQWNYDATQHWKKCSVCKAADPDHPATAHNFGEWVTEKEASCTETGTQKHTCVDCGYSETAEIAMLAHTLTHHEAVAPTCTTTGSIEYWECSVCGKKFSDEACTTEVTNVTRPMAAHTLTKTGAKAATCTEAGNTEYWTCSACGTWFLDGNGEHAIPDHNSVVIPATGHTANENGWYGNDTNHWHVCATCGETFDNEAHRGGHATCSERATCDVCGLKYGSTTDHDYQWQHDDTEHWKACKDCGTIDKSTRANHTFGGWVTEKDSTCTETGTQKHTCTACDYSETGVIDKKAHTPEHHDRVEPTCMATGSIEYWQCSVCSKKFSDAGCTVEVTDVTIPMANHTLTKTDAKAATCTEAGNIEYWTCSVCKKLFSDAEGKTEITAQDTVIAATGHTPSEAWNSDGTDHWHVCTTCNAVLDKAAHSGGTATCQAKAICNVCKAEYGEKADHTFVSKHDDTQHWKECSVCAAIDLDNPKTNHTFGEWETVTDSTCTATGTKKHTCTGCDYSETGVIEKKNHTLDHHDRVEPTCTTTGSIEYWQCSACMQKFSDAACTTVVTDVTLPMANHTLNKTDAKAATCTEAGNTEYWTCSVCKKLFSDAEGKNEITAASVVIPATGHTADESGWNSNGTDHWHVCATCKEKFDEAAHTGGTATCSKKAVCDICKAEYGTTTDHTFVSKNDTVQHWKECSACGAIDPANPKTNHTFGEWETVTDSTCTATGTKKHTCTGCDYSETGVIEKKAHTPEHHDRVEPTCTTTGSIEYWQCGVCGKKFSDAACTTEVTDVTLAKLPHSAGTAWEKDTTYHWHLCTSCGSEVMDKAAHTYGDWVTVTEATETEAGLRKRTCSVCGYEQTEEISMLRFTVTVRNGSGSGEYKSGETVTITADRRSGYTFEKWTVNSGNVTLAKETDSTTTFTMPAENVTVTATYRYNGGSGSGSGSSSGIVIKDENGKVLGKADPDTGIVELPITPVPAASSSRQAEELEITIPKNTTVKVEIPVRNVTPGTVVVIVHADGTEEIVRTSVVTKKGVALELTGSATVKVYDNSKFFTDVPAANWASDAVAFASSRELFNGTGANTFSPNAPMTRQMLMTVLARLDGTDTSGNAYAKGMEWAIRNGVSNGSDPEGKITREQLATMLWRYAGSPSVSGRMTGFVDADQISGYAEDAMLWATKAGIIGGKGNGQLDPKGYATRAEVAAMLMRYCNTLFTK